MFPILKIRMNSFIKTVSLVSALHLCHGQSFDCGAPYTCKSMRDCVDSLRRPEDYVFWRCSVAEEGKICCPPPDSSQDLLRHRNFYLLNDTCERTSDEDRITSGHNATLRQFPWMALIGYEDEIQGTTEYSCGGTVINKRYILTAAHCLSMEKRTPYRKSVRLGELNLSTDPDCIDYCGDPVVDKGIEKVILHPQYNNPFRKNDIALIRVSTDILFTEYIKPICLPFKHFNSTGAQVKYQIAGWGKQEASHYNGSTMLQFAVVTLTPTEECSPLQSMKVQPLSNITQMCAGGQGPDACNGDSGGPLMKLSNGSQPVQQVGIVSLRTGTECGPTASVYTRIEGFLEWILDNIEP